MEIVLPVDLVGATGFAPDAEHDVYPVTEFPADRESLDMGPRTRALFASKLADAKTVFWNGPVGVFEFPAFAAGTRAVAQAISEVRGTDRGRRRRLGGSRSAAGISLTVRSATSPLAAGPAWSTSKARRCPASPRLRTPG